MEGNVKNIDKGYIIIRLIASLLLFIALCDHPYSYYRFLRLFTFIVCIYGLYNAIVIMNKTFSWLFGIIVFIFNPIFPLYFNKGLWHIIDIISGLILLISIILLRKTNSTLEIISKEEKWEEL